MNRIARLEKECAALREENQKLRREMEMSDRDLEIGKKSPKELAIKWLCRAVCVSAYDWQNHELLMQSIDRLIALDHAANAEKKCCCGNNDGQGSQKVCPS